MPLHSTDTTCTKDHLEILTHCSPLLLIYIKSVTPVIITSNTPYKKIRKWDYPLSRFDGLSATCWYCNRIGNLMPQHYLKPLVAPYSYVWNNTQNTFKRHPALCKDTLYRPTLRPVSINDMDVEDITLKKQCAQRMSYTVLTAWFSYCYSQILYFVTVLESVLWLNYGLHNPSCNSRWARDPSLIQNVDTQSGAQPAPHSMLKNSSHPKEYKTQSMICTTQFYLVPSMNEWRYASMVFVGTTSRVPCQFCRTWHTTKCTNVESRFVRVYLHNTQYITLYECLNQFWGPSSLLSKE